MIQIPIHKGMTVLQRELFKTKYTVGALLIHVSFLKEIKSLPGLLTIARFPTIIPTKNKHEKLVLLSMDINHESIVTLPNKIQEWIQKTKCVLTSYEIELDYDYWTTEDILGSILPCTVPSSFSQVGHIAHFNLKPEHEPYKNIIGQVILDKSKQIKTVVNKLDSIDHTFRFFKMELLAGEQDYIATVKESNCFFRFDFSKTYWNSRLQGEHDRLIQHYFKPNDIICDVFGGVGPFGIPAAKKKCFVFSNDLNPISVQYVKENIIMNKVRDCITSFQMDGYDFIKKSLGLVNDSEIWNEFRTHSEIYQKQRRNLEKGIQQVDTVVEKQEMKIPQHYIMNLPATAIDFLKAFIQLFPNNTTLPMIHVYCFSKHQDPITDTIQRVENILGPLHEPKVVKVRNVAPKKDMMCISFRLPKSGYRSSTSAEYNSTSAIVENNSTVVENKNISIENKTIETTENKKNKKRRI